MRLVTVLPPKRPMWMVTYNKYTDELKTVPVEAVVKAIKDQGLVNGKRLRVEEIAEKTGQSVEFLHQFITEHAHGSKDGIRAERLGKHTFRLHPAGKRKPVDPDLLLSMVQADLDELKRMSQLHRARIVTEELYRIATEIERAIKEE